MTCPNCRGETHRFAGRLVCSAGCGWSQDEATPAACTCGPRASHAVRCERCGLPPGVPAPATPRAEPRRPQVGDWIPVACDDEGTEICGAPAQAWESRRVVSMRTGGFLVAAREGGTVGYSFDEEGITWRWPATQGAAAAGPARCLCGHVGAEACLFGEPPPPASEPPPGDMTLFLSQEVEAQRKGVQRERERADAATAARAALEVQLRDEASAAMDMIRASAADDRTREITAKLREGLGPYVPDAPFLSQREIADLIEQAFPDAFPKPGGAK